MSAPLKNNTHCPVTCCFYNPVTGQEKRAGIVPGECLWLGSLKERLFSSMRQIKEKN
jgi:hypothetical protein